MNIRFRLIISVLVMAIALDILDFTVNAEEIINEEREVSFTNQAQDIISRDDKRFVSIYKGLNGGAGAYVHDYSHFSSLYGIAPQSTIGPYVENLWYIDTANWEKTFSEFDMDAAHKYFESESLTTMLDSLDIEVHDSYALPSVPVDESITIQPGNYIRLCGEENPIFQFTEVKRTSRKTNGTQIYVSSPERVDFVRQKNWKEINSVEAGYALYDFEGNEATQYKISVELKNYGEKYMDAVLTLTGDNGFYLSDIYRIYNQRIATGEKMW